MGNPQKTDDDHEGDHGGVGEQDRVFTRYVRAVAASEEPDDALVDAVWQALRRALLAQLRRRGLRSRPPSFLGVLGQASWTAGKGSTQGDALDELVGDCFAFALVDRIKTLIAHSRTQPSIDRIVARSIRNFVHERQQRHDPMGTRVFNVLRSTIVSAVRAGELHVVDGSPRIGATTALAFDAVATDPASAAALAPHVLTWNDELMPELITTTGRGQVKLERRLLACIARLAEVDISAFRFRDVLGPLRLDLRSRWSATLQAAYDAGQDADADASVISLVRTVDALDADLERRDTFEALNRCVEDRLRARDMEAKTLKFVWAVWRALLAWARTRPSEPDSNLASPLPPDVVPSRREVGRSLKIPRDRLPTLYKIIGEFVSGCRSRIHLPSTMSGTPEASPPSTNATMNLKQRQQALIKQSRAAAQRAVEPASPAEDAPADSIRADSIRLGAVYVLDHAGAPGLEWVVLRLPDGPEGRVLLAAADTDPNAGLHDVVVPPGAAGGPLTVRTGYWVSLPNQAFEASPSRVVDREYVDRVLDALRRRRVEGMDELDDITRDDDPDFAEWADEIKHAAADLNARHLTPPAPLPFERPPREKSRRAPGWLMPIAATLALCTFGLALWNQSLRHDAARLERPFVVADGPSVLMFETPRGGDPVTVDPTTDLIDAYLSLRGYSGNCNTFQVELVDSSGNPFWSKSVGINPDGDISLGLERRVFERSPKRVRLYDLCDPSDEPIADKVFPLIVPLEPDDND